MTITEKFVLLKLSNRYVWVLQEEERVSEPLNYLLMTGDYRMLRQEIMEFRNRFSSTMGLTKKGKFDQKTFYLLANTHNILWT